MTNQITIRITDSYRKELDTIAKNENRSVNDVISGILKVGSLMGKYVDSESQVIIKNAKGFDNEQILIPVYEVSNRK